MDVSLTMYTVSESLSRQPGTPVVETRIPSSNLSVEFKGLLERVRKQSGHHIASSVGTDNSFCFTKMDPTSRHLLVPS